MRRPLLVLFTLVLALIAVPRALAAPFMISVVQDDDRLIYSNASARAVTLNRAKLLGADAVRVTVLWSAVAGRAKPRQPANPASYRAANWDKYDDLVRAAQSRGLVVYLVLTPPGPRWSQAKANDPANQRTWKPSAREFGRFVQAVGKRYSGTYHDENEGKGVLPHVGWWGIGNEPNQGGWLMPQSRKLGGQITPTSPSIYRSLLIAGATALVRTGHAFDTVDFGETAPLGVAPQSERRPLRPALFIRELFCLDGRLHAYRGRAAALRGCGNVKQLAVLEKFPRLAFAHHPYTKTLAPTKRDKSRDAITIANINTLPALLDRIAAKTKLIPVGLPVLLTEFGYETNPPDRYEGVTPAIQAEWDNIGDYDAYRCPRCFANTQFMLYDAAPLKQFPKGSKAYWFTYQSGLFFNNGAAKPSALAYMLPFMAKRAGTAANFWGMVRFTANGANQTIVLQEKPSANGAWQTVGAPIQVTNSVGFWEAQRPAQKGQIWRAVWVSTDGSTTQASREITLS
jgi:hypothetical protein